MMKEKIFILVSIIFIELILTVNVIFSNNTEHFIENNNDLYEQIVQNIYDNYEDSYKDKNNYKLFIDYHVFGTTESNDYKYAYIWLVTKSFYVNNNRIISGLETSMPYKIRFNKYNSIIDYEYPEEDIQYELAINKMVPNKIKNDVLLYKKDEEKIMREVKEYYSDLEDKTIYYED